MKPFKLIFLLLLIYQTNILAQGRNFGIQVGNNISLPHESISENFKDRILLRYSIGFFGKKRIAENLKARFITPLRKGVIDLDYGLNIVVKGFDYKFGNIESSTDQVSFEFPILLNLFDERNVFMSRKQLRKGINTFARIGLKPSFSPKGNYSKSIRKSDEFVLEEMSEGRFNLIGSLGGGLMQKLKNGNLAFFEVSANLGLIKRTIGTIKYEKVGSQIVEEVYEDRGSYISMNVGYYFNWKKSNNFKSKMDMPEIFNPRFL